MRNRVLRYPRASSDSQTLHIAAETALKTRREAVKSRVKAVASREDSRNASCGSGKTFYAF